MVFPGGSTNNASNAPAMLVLQAHNWPEEPYEPGGSRIGRNPVSQRLGAQDASQINFEQVAEKRGEDCSRKKDSRLTRDVSDLGTKLLGRAIVHCRGINTCLQEVS
jgi:hypothetical protein